MIIGLKQIEEMWKQNLNDEYLFQVYIHSPFCKTICKFCAYKGMLLKPGAYDIYYNKYLPNLITIFSDIIGSRKVDAFYFGGGTPSLMKLEDMESIFSMIPNFSKSDNKYFEIHPAFFDNMKMQLLKDFNFQTVTFGIQTFNNSEIERMNRYEQDFDHVLELVQQAKELGLKVGIDLLLWEGNRNLYEDLIKADELEFDVIFAAIDYSLQTEEAFIYFINSINRFLGEKSYSVSRERSIAEEISINKNIRLFRNGKDSYQHPGVFDYDSNFGTDITNDTTATLALGSFGKQMVPTTSNIGSKIIYQESNKKWAPEFNLIKKREPFIWRAAP